MRRHRLKGLMNSWVKESIAIANSPRYLDKLQRVYPVTIGEKRSLPTERKGILRKAFESSDDVLLFKELLNLKKFPLKDPYVAFFRKSEKFIEYNPDTIKRICRHIRALGYDKMLEGVEEPKEFNRTIGPLFRKWWTTLGYPILPAGEFRSRSKGIVILDGSPDELRIFANERLEANLEKRPDIVAKHDGRYMIGEAKFITDLGGHQNTQLQDALELLRSRSGRVKRVAILDGVIWIRGKNKMHQAVSQTREDVFTALLLKDYLENL